MIKQFLLKDKIIKLTILYIYENKKEVKTELKDLIKKYADFLHIKIKRQRSKNLKRTFLQFIDAEGSGTTRINDFFNSI